MKKLLKSLYYVNIKYPFQVKSILSFGDNIRYIYYNNLLLFLKNKDRIYNKLHKLNLSFLYDNVFSKEEISKLEIRKNDKPIDEFYIWTLWWQGYENMPDIIKATIKSIQKVNNKKVIVLNKNNISNYIQIPNYILKKVQEHKMGLAHFSDYIRVSLLCKYGGLWIDSSILCIKPIPEWVYSEKFFTIKADPNGSKYIPMGKWNMQVIGSCMVNCPIFVFMKLYLEKYWSKYDIAFNYLFFDYGMYIQYDNLEISKEYINNVPKTNSRMHVLREVLNSRFDKKLWDDEICSDDTWMYKLTYKEKFISKIDNKETFYSYVTNVC